MEKNYMQPDALVELEYLTDRKTGIHYHENPELLYVMGGEVDVSIEDATYHLVQDDLILINANRKHAYEGTENLFLGRFSLSYVKIREMLKQDTLLFWCNSTVDQNGAFEELRNVIRRIFAQSVKEESTEIYRNSLYYQMLYILTENFLLTAGDVRYRQEKGDDDDRMREIFDYIRSNYRSNITLNSLAEKMYLSPAYLSKYIKKKCGENFLELVNAVRLGHAMNDLMFSDNSVMKIAMDNGFANVAAYNKAFKDAYHTTPTEFRKEKKKDGAAGRDRREKDLEQIRSQVGAYLEHHPEEERDGVQQALTDTMDIPADGETIGTWNRSFTRMVNAGTAKDLTKSVCQEQILWGKKQLGFTYVRFWDLYDPEFFLDTHLTTGHAHFGQLDIALDFLVRNGLKPYIELAVKPLKVMSEPDAPVWHIDRERPFASTEEIRGFYTQMMEHFVKYFGAEEVATWYFECWEKERYEETTGSQIPLGQEEHEDYFRYFDIMAGALRSVLPEARIGGAGFPLRHYGKEGFARILRQWKAHAEQPDFITLSCYPYDQVQEAGVFYEKKSTDPDFMLHTLKEAREVLQEEGFSKVELHVSEYSFSLSNRNAVNDSCIKGAFMLRNAISCGSLADLAGHWLYSDQYADFSDTTKPLFGGCGLITREGIPKPSFYALQFVSKLYDRIVAADTYCLATVSPKGSVRLVCHNFKPLNIHYHLTKVDQIRIRDLSSMTDDRGDLTLYLTVTGLQNGTWLLRQKRVNERYGSVQDEWHELGEEPDLGRDDLEYLRQVTAPKLTVQEQEVTDHTLQIKVVLRPSEIRSLHLTKK